MKHLENYLNSKGIDTQNLSQEALEEEIQKATQAQRDRASYMQNFLDSKLSTSKALKRLYESTNIDQLYEIIDEVYEDLPESADGIDIKKFILMKSHLTSLALQSKLYAIKLELIDEIVSKENLDQEIVNLLYSLPLSKLARKKNEITKMLAISNKIAQMQSHQGLLSAQKNGLKDKLIARILESTRIFELQMLKSLEEDSLLYLLDEITQAKDKAKSIKDKIKGFVKLLESSDDDVIFIENVKQVKSKISKKEADFLLEYLVDIDKRELKDKITKFFKKG